MDDVMIAETPFYQFSPQVLQAAGDAEARCRAVFEGIQQVEEYNQQKVLRAFADNRVSETHFYGSTGYGYGDMGRETLDAVYAQVFGAQDALVRHNFVSGTHALATALFGVLRPGDVLLAVTGAPYDTLEEVIGLRGEGNGSLKDFGVQYRQVDLREDSQPDYLAISKNASTAKVVYIQRSRGYSLRDSLSVDTIAAIIQQVRRVNHHAIVMVDNCYGEFVETREPTQAGADLIIGSLIKNPGGGIARTGGYIAGRKDLIELCSYRLTSPGMGKEVGCTLGESQRMFMGLFFAPSVVASAVKTAVFASAMFESFGYAVYPRFDEHRTDIIQAVRLGSPEGLCAFCRGIQKGAPVDSYVTPEPWDMPGYDSPVIMAAGAFTGGASIELSADGPMREPYAAWMQGGLTYSSGKTGVMLAAQSMLDSGVLKL